MEFNDYLVVAMFVTFIGFLFTGYPIAWVLGGVACIFTLVGYCADRWFGTVTGLDYLTLGLSVNRIYKFMDNWVLVALPMFIFMGLMLDRSGIAEGLMKSMQNLFGKVRGGLAVTVTTIGIILAASTGIIGASVVLLGLLSLPAMLKQGYSKQLALGTIASSGTLGILIPPSIMLVIMADQLGLSVGDLFMGALIPGVILGVLYIVFILLFCLIRPDAAPLDPDRRPLELKMIWDVLKHIFPPALLILAVLGSIFAGITTPTEASGVGALGAMILAAVNKKLNLKVLAEVTKACFNTTAYIFAIFLGATCFALVLRSLGGDEFIERMLTGIPLVHGGILRFTGPSWHHGRLTRQYISLRVFPGLDRNHPDRPAPHRTRGLLPGLSYRRPRCGRQSRTGLVRRAHRGQPADLLSHAACRICLVLPQRHLPG